MVLLSQMGHRFCEGLMLSFSFFACDNGLVLCDHGHSAHRCPISGHGTILTGMRSSGRRSVDLSLVWVLFQIYMTDAAFLLRLSCGYTKDAYTHVRWCQITLNDVKSKYCISKNFVKLTKIKAFLWRLYWFEIYPFWNPMPVLGLESPTSLSRNLVSFLWLTYSAY